MNGGTTFTYTNLIVALPQRPPPLSGQWADVEPRSEPRNRGLRTGPPSGPGTILGRNLPPEWPGAI